MLRSIFKFLASLQLALLLLAVIIVATAIGTVYESDFSAEVARKHIYNAWWFNAWMAMLCINLFCVAAIRYPWKPHQTGFVITHAGIIIMLIGGMIDRQWGMEGFIPLTRGEPPTDVVELHEQEVLVRVDGGKDVAATTVVNKAILGPNDFKLPIKSPTPDVKVEIIDKFPPLAQLVLQGPQMGRHEFWVFLNDTLPLGPAMLQFREGMPPAPQPPKMAPRRERHFVFAKHDTPIAKAVIGEMVGAHAKLEVDPAGEKPMIHLDILGKHFDIDVKSNIEKSLPLEGLADWRFYIVGYYPNFRMQEGVPGNLDDKPENPAVFFELNGPLVAVGEEGEEQSGRRRANNFLTLYLGNDGKLRYFMKSRSKGESAGELELNKPVPAWGAPGTEFVVQQFIPQGLTELAMKNAPEIKGLAPKRMEERNPGLLFRVTVGSESKNVWLHEMRAKDFEMRKVEVGGKTVELAMPRRFIEMPFKVALEKFYAPKVEGENVGNTFTSFESTLSFQDKLPKNAPPGSNEPFKQLDIVRLKEDSAVLKEMGAGRALIKEPNTFICAITDISDTHLTLDFADRATFKVPLNEVVEYKRHTHKISMNRPTVYPYTWYAPWLGTSFKFSQAGHDPDMPDYSGVQVLRDPGWMPKWVGSLMICFGIFTMFYLKPYFQGRREIKKAELESGNKDVKAESGKKAKRAEKATV
ncbi:MAG TPA: hypothetical protein VEK08_12250 [Planctomycetota bacterium]|nr:hypothetical protein [Planctomycetota bacterium]